MAKDGIWIQDPSSGEPTFVFYDELDDDILAQLWRPVAGSGFCFEADSFVRLALPQVPYYLQGWLPERGRLEIYGQPKSGKSFSALQLARCIGSGIPFLGMPTTQAKVLYIQLELGQRVLQDRMRNTGHDYPNVYLGTTFAMKLDTRTGQEYLWQALKAVEPKVLILDPFYKLLQGDENESHDVLVITDFLDTVLEGFECSIVIYHHPGKDLSRGGRGSSVLEGWVDSYIEMKRTSKKGEPLRIKLTPMLLRHAELPPESIAATLKNNEFVLEDAPPSVLEQVEGFMRVNKGSPVTAQEIIDAGVGSRGSVYNALNTLQRQKIIGRVGRGDYVFLGGDNSGEELDKAIADGGIL